MTDRAQLAALVAHVEERDPLDRFYTPPALALACLRWLAEHLDAGGHLYEPAAGGGAWMTAAEAT